MNCTKGSEEEGLQIEGQAIRSFQNIKSRQVWPYKLHTSNWKYKGKAWELKAHKKGESWINHEMALTKSSSDENTWDWKHCYNLKKQETQEAEEHKTFATVEDEEMANY